MTNFQEAFMKMNEDFHRAANSGEGKDYAHLSYTVQRFEAGLREYIQYRTEEDMNEIMRKLKRGQEISPKDIERIKLWIISDADSYVRLENNFKDWLAELKRLVDEVNKYKGVEPDLDTAAKLRGLLRDSIRILNNISYYSEEKERVENFNRTVETLDEEERLLLKRILEQKLKSPNF